MADIYDRSKKLATRMLAPRNKGGKGLACQVVQTVEGEYDPTLGGAPETVTTIDTSAVRTNYANKDIDGSNIKSDDVLFLVSPVQLTGIDMPVISTSDKIIFDGNTYTIITAKPWNYAGLNIGFEIQGRV